jgi:hypothetical protein
MDLWKLFLNAHLPTYNHPKILSVTISFNVYVWAQVQMDYDYMCALTHNLKKWHFTIYKILYSILFDFIFWLLFNNLCQKLLINDHLIEEKLVYLTILCCMKCRFFFTFTNTWQRTFLYINNFYCFLLYCFLLPFGQFQEI